MNTIFKRFLEVQYEEGIALAAASDLLKLQPLRMGNNAPQHYIATFFCDGFVENHGQISKASRFEVGFYFPDHYLLEANTAETLTWRFPANIQHPNIRPPFLCIGDRFMRPGTKLVELIYQVYSVVTFTKWAAHSPLNENAAQWARANQHLLPADSRPLKRRPSAQKMTPRAERSES